MNTLQFVDAMTGRLAWPIAAVMLGLLFRRALAQLMGRVRRLAWGDAEAELAEAAEAADGVQAAIEQVANPASSDGEAVKRSNLEKAVQEAVALGFMYAKGFDGDAPPLVEITWSDDGQPNVRFTAEPGGRGRITLGPIVTFPPGLTPEDLGLSGSPSNPRQGRRR